jgi:hypothetical protein
LVAEIQGQTVKREDTMKHATDIPMASSCMTQDLPLFAAAEQVRRSSRITDPVSSRHAARTHEATGRRQSNSEVIRALIEKHPGCTAPELARLCHHDGIDRYEVSRRCPELERSGFVSKGPLRTCGVNRRPMLTWYPVRVVIPATANAPRDCDDSDTLERQAIQAVEGEAELAAESPKR